MFQAFSILSAAKDEDTSKKQALHKFYTDAERCLNDMDEKILALLQKNVGNVREKIKHHQEQLKRKEYFLLVAGKLEGCFIICKAFRKFQLKNSPFLMRPGTGTK